MAIAFDAASQGTVSSGTSLTVSHTCTGASRVLMVGVDTFDLGEDNGPQNPTLTYDTIALTSLVNTTYTPDGSGRITLYRLTAPTELADDIVVTLTGDSDEIVLGATSYTGVDQTTPNDTAAAVFVTDATVITQDISSETGDLVIDFVSWYNQTITIGSGQTARVENDGGSTNDSLFGSSEPGAGTVTMSWSWSGNERAGQVAVNLNAVGDQILSPALVSQLIAGVAPAITTGNVDLAPSLESQLLAGIDPAVTSNVNLAPSLESQLLTGVAPAVTTGNVNLSPALVSQLLAGVDPALSIDVTPALESQLLAGVDPAVTTGNVNLSPALESQLLAGVAPTVTTGNVNLVLSLVSQLLAGVAPAITTVNLDLSPELVSQLLEGIDPAVGGGEHSLAPGFDIARFYRRNISGSELLVLVVGTPRSVAKGFRADESWDHISGHFALPAEPRHPEAKKEAIGQVITAWDANKTASQAVLTAALNAALITAGYTRPHGAPIT